MINPQIMTNYAVVMKDIAIRDNIYNVDTLNKLKDFFNDFHDSWTLTKYLTFYGNKKNQLDTIAEIFAHYEISNFFDVFRVACEFNHGYLLLDIVSIFIKNSNKLGKSIALEILTPFALSSLQEKQICDAVSAFTKSVVTSTVKIDPLLIGGLKVSGEGFRFDNSIKTKLNKILKGFN